MQLRVAGAQIPVTLDVARNAVAIERAVEYAAAERAGILLTPEGSLSGYTHAFDRTDVQCALTRVCRAAAERGVALALGTCYEEPSDGRCYNQVRFYDREGRFLGFHSKTLTCGSLTDPPKGEVEVYSVSPLRTFEVQGVALGALICNDLWANPACTPQDDSHLTHRLASMGARVVLHAVNGGRGDRLSGLCWQYHESNLRLRAAASRLWIVTVDSCAPVGVRCSAPSGVVTPDGEWALLVQDRGEQLFAHTIEVADDAGTVLP